MRALLLVLAVGLASAIDLDAEWATFKNAYGKQYKDTEEENYRRSVWQYHLNYIQQHNLEADLGIHSFSLGINEFADMPNKEFVEMMTGHLAGARKSEGGALYMAPSNVGALPSSVDWRKKGYVTPVKNQGQCGSCWAFSATGSLEGQHFKETGKLVSLSEQNLVDCSRKEGNLGCQGGLMDQAFKYIKLNHGIDTEASYPYKAKNEKCHFSAAHVGANVTGFVDVTSMSESDLKSAVATVGPISVAIDASGSKFQLYHSGVYYNSECSQTQLDHGVLAAGYGVLETKDYWLVKNSWGAAWGMKGYIMMSRNRDNNCGIATQASYPTV